MKLIIALFLSTVLAFPHSVIIGRGAAPVAAACGGTDWDNSDNEAFENASGMFCTTGWGLLGTTNQITQVTAQYVSTGNSCNITQGGTYHDSYIWQQFTSSAFFSFRFWFRVDGIGGSLSGNIVRLFEIDSASTFGAGTCPFACELRNSSSTLQLRPFGTTSPAGLNISANTWYRIEARYQPNTVPSGCTLTIYNAAGTQLNTWDVLSNSSANKTHLGIGFVPGSNANFTGLNFWIDDVKFDPAGALPIGP